jgi:hypothetical protein
MEKKMFIYVLIKKMVVGTIPFFIGIIPKNNGHKKKNFLLCITYYKINQLIYVFF